MLADGSVRFISENISTSVFIALSTRECGEIVGEFSSALVPPERVVKLLIEIMIK